MKNYSQFFLRAFFIVKLMFKDSLISFDSLIIFTTNSKLSGKVQQDRKEIKNSLAFFAMLDVQDYQRLYFCFLASIQL